MSRELTFLGLQTGLTLTAQLWQSAILITSGITVSENGTTGCYYADMPGGTAAGNYDFRAIDAASTQLSAWGKVYWDGSAEITTATNAAVIATRASQTSVNAIPTNPLLTADARLNHLDAAITSRATQASVNAIPTNPMTSLGTTAPVGWINAASIEASALNSKGDWSTYAGGDTSGVTTLLTRLTATRAAYLDNLSTAFPAITDIAAAVWGYTGGRFLSAFGFAVNVGQWGGTNVGGMPNATAPNNADIAAIRAKTDNLPSSPAAISDIPTAAQNRVEMDTNSTQLAALSTAMSAIVTMIEATGGGLYRFTTGALANIPTPSTLTAQQVWEYADRTLSGFAVAVRSAIGMASADMDTQLARILSPSITEGELQGYNNGTLGWALLRLFLNPADNSLVVVSLPSANDDECVLFVGDTRGDGRALAGRRVVCTLITSEPASIGGYLIDKTTVSAVTDVYGKAYLILKRNDLITPNNTLWEIDAPDMRIHKARVSLTSSTPQNLIDAIRNVP